MARGAWTTRGQGGGVVPRTSPAWWVALVAVLLPCAFCQEDASCTAEDKAAGRCEGAEPRAPPSPPARPPPRMPPPPFVETRQAFLSGPLLGASGHRIEAEAIASTGHDVVISIVNDAFVEEPAVADVVSSLARASGDSEDGWNAKLLGGTKVDVRRVSNHTLAVRVPQLVGYRIEEDERVHVELASALLQSSAGGMGHALRAEPAFTIRAVYPCLRDRPDCESCISYNDPGHNHSHECMWCPDGHRCLPSRDQGTSRAECEGLTMHSCPANPSRGGGSDEPDDPAPAPAPGPNTPAAGGGGGGGDDDDDGDSAAVLRIGIGVHVLNLANIDLQNGLFYADFEVYLHQEMADAHGNEYPRGQDALHDPSMQECGNMRYWKPYMPRGAQTLSDFGLNLVNVDRLRSVNVVYGANHTMDHIRVQSHFFFRTNVTSWPLNVEALELMLEETRDSTTYSATRLFCHMPEYSGLSDSIRLPGTIDNRLLTYSWRVRETCNPPYYRPVRQCSNNASSLFEEMCDCVPVEDFDDDGFFDRESCGCRGGRRPATRFFFSVNFRFPEVAAVLTAFLAPVVISFVNLASYLVPPDAIETRFNLCGSTLLATVMFHVSLKQQTPQSSVLTLADRVMFAIYTVIVSSFLISTIIMMAHFAKYRRLTKGLFLLFRPVGPGLSLALLGSQALHIETWNSVCVTLGLTFVGAGILHLSCRGAALCARGMRPWRWNWRRRNFLQLCAELWADPDEIAVAELQPLPMGIASDLRAPLGADSYPPSPPRTRSHSPTNRARDALAAQEHMVRTQRELVAALQDLQREVRELRDRRDVVEAKAQARDAAGASDHHHGNGSGASVEMQAVDSGMVTMG